jgi:small subunit ribosomal protein S13
MEREQVAEKKKPEAKGRESIESQETLVRILGQDMLGSKGIYVSLTKIKGVSWAIANAVCHNLNLDRRKKVVALTKDDIKKIEHELLNVKIPVFMKNRRSDIDTGEDLHLLTTNLDIKREFDIKRLKKIKSYKGIRHSLGLPVRGQKTRSHFRTKGRAVGVAKKKDVKKA